MELGFPLLSEYLFQNVSDECPLNINLDLKPGVELRPFQKNSLDNIFRKGTLKSGLIILPCGAGKSLVGVAACCRLRQKAIVLCNSVLSMEQWKDEFLRWSTVSPDAISCLTSTSSLKELKHVKQESCDIVISTYEMVANQKKRSPKGQEMMDWLSQQVFHV